MDLTNTNSLTPTQKLLCFKFLGAGFATVALAVIRLWNCEFYLEVS